MFRENPTDTVPADALAYRDQSISKNGIESLKPSDAYMRQ